MRVKNRIFRVLRKRAAAVKLLTSGPSDPKLSAAEPLAAESRAALTSGAEPAAPAAAGSHASASLPKLRLISEEAGIMWFGKEIQPVQMTETEVKVIEIGLGNRTMPRSWFQEVSGLKKAKPEKAFTTLKRIDKQQILSEAHLYKVDEDKLEVISEKSHEILSQTLILGWILMRWRQDLPLSLPSAHQLHEVNLVHPELIGLYLQAQEDCVPESIVHFRKCIKDFSIGAKRLLLPICAQGHWCLLTLDFTESGIEARYRDSLSKQSHATRGRAEELLHTWDSDMAVPEVLQPC